MIEQEFSSFFFKNTYLFSGNLHNDICNSVNSNTSSLEKIKKMGAFLYFYHTYMYNYIHIFKKITLKIGRGTLNA